MGLSKNELFEDRENTLAEIARVLAHPARIAILQHILDVGKCVNSELVKDWGLAQPTVTQHLKELKNIGLIKGRFMGKQVNYCIDEARWKEFRTLLVDFFYQTPPDDSSCAV
jgi:DNA-binding transcriptional ArsR family regulator